MYGGDNNMEERVRKRESVHQAGVVGFQKARLPPPPTSVLVYVLVLHTLYLLIEQIVL